MTREFTTGDDDDDGRGIYTQLNSRHTTYFNDDDNYSKQQNLSSYTKHSPSSKSPLQRTPSPYYPSTSPLKSRHTNSLYLHEMKSSQKKGGVSSSVYHEGKFLERDGGRENLEGRDGGKRVGDGGVFRRF